MSKKEQLALVALYKNLLKNENIKDSIQGENIKTDAQHNNLAIIPFYLFVL